MNILWVQIRSWHALADGEALRTRCGRMPHSDSEVASELPTGKSCETCLRIVARKVDEPLPEDGDVGE